MATFITAGYVYGELGAVIAAAFVLVGVDRIDAAARGAWLAQLVWLPGLWPAFRLIDPPIRDMRA